LKDIGLLILRGFSGAFMFFGHGLSKLQNLLAGNLNFADPLGLGQNLSLILSTFAEFFCAGLLILGLFPRVSAGILIINMFVAGFIQHSSDPFAVKEKALIYLVIFIALLIFGGGKYSINELLPSKYRKF
jgi:putative oxidoreductase